MTNAKDQDVATSILQAIGFQRPKVGDVVVTALNDGFIVLPPEVFQGIDAQEQQTLYRAAGRQPPFPASINGYVLQWDGWAVLIDAGAGGFTGPRLGKLRGNLAGAGVTPANIDTVLLTHMHTDHIGGLLAPDRTALFLRAKVMVSALEIAYWLDQANQDTSPETTRDAFDVSASVFAAYGDRLVTFSRANMPPRVKAIALPGHTPGHTGFEFTTDVGPFVVWGDICHAPEVQCPRPDVTVVFDVSPVDAIGSRYNMLARAAFEDLLIAGMHMPFPGFTRIGRVADGYAQHPEAWQYDLEA
jgi:glyoxylase-like metal-dependent hydrolase (beta-lactamase superfamily II)